MMKWCLMSSDVSWQVVTNAEAWFNIALRPRKPEGSLGRTAQDGHLDSHTAPELFTLPSISDTFKYFLIVRRDWCLMLTAGTNSKLCEHGVSSRRLSWLSRSELSPLSFHWVVVSGSGHCPCDFVPSQLLKEEAVKYKLLYGSGWVPTIWIYTYCSGGGGSERLIGTTTTATTTTTNVALPQLRHSQCPFFSFSPPPPPSQSLSVSVCLSVCVCVCVSVSLCLSLSRAKWRLTYGSVVNCSSAFVC